jgi:predicted O-methyltransferase YrrM
MNNRTELINVLADAIKAKSYLEIGVSTGDNFKNVNILEKISVDIHAPCNADYQMSSDDFFEMNGFTFDIIFVDGYHEKKQVLKDINNSLKILNQNGFIITHDTLPLQPDSLKPRVCWNAWEAFVYLRKTNPNIKMASVITKDDTYTGCGIIKHGKQELFEPEVMDFDTEYYKENIRPLMNIIETPETFKSFIFDE